jgi:MFS family permease
MTQNEIAWLIGLSLFGATTGIVSGWIAARRSKGMENALIGALLAAAAVPLIFCFISGFFESHQPKGFSIINAVLAGFGMMMYLGIGMVAFAVPASVASAIASHAVFSRCCRKTEEAQQAAP